MLISIFPPLVLRDGLIEVEFDLVNADVVGQSLEVREVGVEVGGVFVGEHEVKGQLVVIEVVDKVPEDLFIEFTHRCYVHFHFFTLEEQ